MYESFQILEQGNMNERARKTPRTDHSVQSPPSDVVNHNVESIVADIMHLEDICSDPNGDSSKKQDREARRQFLNFLGPSVTTFENIPSEIITKDTIGRFCTFMHANTTLRLQSAMSSIRRQLEKVHNVAFFQENPQWYSDLRHYLIKQYVLTSLRG